MYNDTLELDISFDVPVRRLALFSRKMFYVPVRPMDAKGLRVATVRPTHTLTKMPENLTLVVTTPKRLGALPVVIIINLLALKELTPYNM